MLESTIRQLLRDTNQITSNPVLDKFSVEKCKEIDERAATDSFVQDRRRVCLNSFQGTSVAYEDSFKTAFDAYNEIVVFDSLVKKGTVSHQQTIRNTSTPDYVWTTRDGHEMNIDLKTLSYNYDKENFRNIQNQSVLSKLSIEEQLQNGSRVAIGEPIIHAPFKRGDEKITNKTVIESFIKKAKDNYKKEQLCYKEREGILLIDTVLLGHPVFEQEALPFFIFPKLRCPKSGVLWNCCFGQIGDRIFDIPEFEGLPNINGELQMNGILTGETALKAVIFIIHQGNEYKLLGFRRTDVVSDNIVNALNEICDFVNDEVNTFFFEMPFEVGGSI